MATSNFNIKFSALLFSDKNEAVKEFPVQVEFYSTQDNQWTILTESKTNGLGIFSSTFEIPTRISKNDEITRAIKDTLSSGGIPIFRFICFDEKKQKNILGNVTKVDIDNEELLININFGKNWFLPSKKFINLEKNVFFITSNHFDDTTEFQNCLNNVALLNEELKNKSSEFENLQKENGTLKTENKQLINDLSNCQKELKLNEEKLKKCNLLKENIENDLKNTQNELIDVKKDFEKCKSNNNDYESLNKKHQELLQKFNDSVKLVDDLNKIKKENELKIKELDNNIVKLENEKNQIQEEKNRLENEKQKCELALNSCKDNLQKCESKDYQKLEEELKILKDGIVDLNQHLEICKNDKLNLIKQRDSLQSKLDEATQFNTSENPNKVEAKTVYTGIVSELRDAQELMKDSNFKIGNIKLNLKAMVNKSPTGINYELLDATTAREIPNEAISTIEMEVSMVEPIESSNSDFALPNLIGLTETAVRKKLNLIGCKLNPIYNSESGTDRVIGQSFKQSPETGQSISTNQEVTVFFAK